MRISDHVSPFKLGLPGVNRNAIEGIGPTMFQYQPEIASDCSYPVTVNYGLTLEQMIAAGRYDWANGEIDKAGFVINGHGDLAVNLELAYPGRNILSDGFIANLDPEIHRVATAEEGLAFGAKYPEIQRQYPIVILGSVGQIEGEGYVLGLYCSDTERDLHLYWYGHDWGILCRFLVVRKNSD